MTTFQLAQINIGRIRASLDDPRMRAFVERLADINALADRAPGFVWRLQTPAGDATYLRPYDDDRIIVNMSVWESVETLKDFVYRSAHAEVMKQRRDWFERFESNYLALWWVPTGHRPGIDEAKKRLAHLEAHGPTEYAFTFKTIFDPDEAFLSVLDWSAFVPPCPAA
jgi:hypothetical protein